MSLPACASLDWLRAHSLTPGAICQACATNVGVYEVDLKSSTVSACEDCWPEIAADRPRPRRPQRSERITDLTAALAEANGVEPPPRRRKFSVQCSAQDCGTVIGGFPSAEPQSAVLARHGWATEPDGSYYCPQHAKPAAPLQFQRWTAPAPAPSAGGEVA
ncbi:MAG: hypothetical protein AAF604_04745 [Acidobacteriota bacterium]